MQNPFSLSFGKEPLSYISRGLQTEEVMDSFTSQNPAYQVCMITGVRGSGKTVAMTTIAGMLRKRPDWVVVDLNPERDLLKQAAAELSNRKELMQMFRDAKINLSFLGMGIEIDGEPPITEVVVAMRRMLEKLTKAGKRVLFTVDEASSTQAFRVFASQIQIFMREDLNVFLLMTGLYENIAGLQDNKTLTFLYRAPKLELKPLNIGLIANKYKDIFHLTDEESLKMAKVTEGYPFAFQVLGYLCWARQCSWQEALPEFDAYLEEYVYEKIWSELSVKDREIVTAISRSECGKVEAIRDYANLSSSMFNVYRKRLMRRGILCAPSYGYVAFTLPRFKEFVLRNDV